MVAKSTSFNSKIANNGVKTDDDNYSIINDYALTISKLKKNNLNFNKKNNNYINFH